ncbi:MAG: hypothetical protein EpisKO_41420 [Epibacterium sp.]
MTDFEILAEANRIKARLQKCQTAAEVERVSDEERAVVMAWKDAPQPAGAMFHHVVNLKRYMLADLAQRTRGAV